MELRPGGAVELVFNNGSLCKPGDEAPEKYGHQGTKITMHGRIVACEPPHLLQFTWAEPDEGINAAQGSEVTFELTSQGNNTLLVLTHRRLKPGEQMEGVAAGWHAHLTVLMGRVGDRESPSFWSTYTALEAEYQKRLGAA